jgi:hypothetical protein
MPAETIPGLFESFSTSFDEVVHQDLGGILLDRELVSSHQNVLGLESGIHCEHLLIAA